MNFTETEEQRMLRDAAREFVSARFPAGRVAELADGDGFDPAEWHEIAELGWTGISAPEEAGGAGMGFLEEAVVAEELGRGLFPGPFFSTVVLALPALGSAPDLLEEVVAGKTITTLAWAGPDGRFETSGFSVGVGSGEQAGHLYGSAWFVPDLGLADLVVVAGEGHGGPGLWAVRRDAESVSSEDLPTVDTTRRMGALFLEGAEGRLLCEGDSAVALLEEIRTRALAALSAEAVGVASRALDLAVDHARTREQFGRPIGTFQAVSQQLADAYVEIESARSLAQWAALTVAEGAEEASVAASAAKAFAAEAAVRTCERSIQVHGGIGFTWEHPLHRYYKRAEWIEASMGRPSSLREGIAAHLLD